MPNNNQWGMTQYQVAPKVIISQQESTGAVNIKVVATRDLEWYLAKAAGDDSGENQNQGNNPSLVSESIFSIFTQKLFKPGTWQPPVGSVSEPGQLQQLPGAEEHD